MRASTSESHCRRIHVNPWCAHPVLHGDCRPSPESMLRILMRGFYVVCELFAVQLQCDVQQLVTENCGRVYARVLPGQIVQVWKNAEGCRPVNGIRLWGRTETSGC